MNENLLILLAEDHPVNQKVALLLLNRFGFQAEAVDDGRKAVEAAKTGKYGLILMDIMMPDMDGLEATRLIREWERTTGARPIPILALTALAMVGDKQRCVDAGMDDYITKPIEPEVLKSKVRKWMRRYELATELQSADINHQIDLEQLREAYGEEDVQELLDLFLHITYKSLSDLEAGIKHGDFRPAERLAHELTGSSAAIYARPFAALCAQLEEAARKEDADGVRTLFPQVREAFAQLERSLNDSSADS